MSNVKQWAHRALVAAAIGMSSVAIQMTLATTALSQTLHIGQNADLTSFDPTELRIGTYVSTHLLYNSLIRLDEKGVPQPELAKSWKLSPDGQTMTLSLVDGATFHSGRAMTSKDVAFSLEYAKTPSVGANILPLARLIEKVETPDEKTVVLHLKGAPAAIYDLLDLLFIVDSENPKRIKTSGNGTGPFKLVSYEPGQNAVFVRNEKYWRQKPVLPKIEIKIVPDTQSALAQLRSGAIDFLPVVNQESLTQIKSLNFKTGVAAAEGRVLDIGINIKSPPFDKPEVRKALSLAIDRQRIASDVAGQGAVAKCLPWAQRSKAESAGFDGSCQHDLAEAKALIQKAGVAGTDVELLAYSQAVPELGAMAQILQASMKEIGLNAKITDLSEAAFVSRFRKSNFQITTHVYVRAGRSPAAILLTAVPFRSVGNVANFESQPYADDVNVVTTGSDAQMMAPAWKRINEQILSQNFVIPVSTLPVTWVATPKLDGVRFNLDGMPIFEHATLK